MDKINNLSELFEKTRITDPSDNSEIEFKKIWETNTIPLLLIHWMRRFG